jgi:hypothetical protein
MKTTMVDYEYYYDQYRRIPQNSASAQRSLLEYNSTVSTCTYNVWSGTLKQPCRISHIDGSTLLGLHERPYSMKGFFPKGKGLRKRSTSYEKKIVNI